MALFGVNPIIASNLNMLLQSIVLIFLLVGYRFGRNKVWQSLRKHQIFMRVMVPLNLLGIIFVMLPSFISAFDAVLAEPFEIHFPLTILHATFGAASASLGITLVFKKFGNVRFWMRFTIAMWLITLALGFLVYYRVFTILHAQGLA